MEELGRLLCNVAAVVPEGIVVFFSSFDYESLVYESWKTSGILLRIQKKKRVFREPRSSNEVELILKDYREAIYGQDRRGALLLAIVGGKVSEGINFSDGMGRCVVMVGLPYPNPSDVELTERVKYIDRMGKSTTGGREYYENLCMKAVNQSVGEFSNHEVNALFSFFGFLTMLLTFLAGVKAERSGILKIMPPFSSLTHGTYKWRPDEGPLPIRLTNSPSG